jgi:hypothetical protein
MYLSYRVYILSVTKHLQNKEKKQFQYKVRIILIYSNESIQNNRVFYSTRFTKAGN